MDQGQIEQVLLNLYVNSWQAMPGGGSLYIQTNNIVIDEYFSRPYHVDPGEYVKISVTDTGAGGQLRLGANNEFKAWVNGVKVPKSTKSNADRDNASIEVKTV